jgi:regulator of sigma E protease
VVAAGPVANLVLAVLLYALVNWVGVQEPRAVLAPPAAGSLAAQAGLQGATWWSAARWTATSWSRWPRSSLRWLLTRGALDGQDVVLEVAGAAGTGRHRELRLPLSSLAGHDPDASLFRAIGITAPLSRPLIGEVVPGGAAERAGLQPGDLVRRMGDVVIDDGQQLRERIRASARDGEPRASDWQIVRGDQVMELSVRPDAVQEPGQPNQRIGRIGAMVGGAPEMVLVRLGPVDGLWSGVTRVWEVSALSLRLLGRMAMGEASLRNLSGPMTIADYAGRSASLGLTYYLAFLAFISVSLGVLNLLPIPVLDGGT